MAETLVNLILGKLGDAAVKEVLQTWGVEEQVERVRRELDWIRAFLKDADRKRIEDEMQKQWVREVREVAYRIEDAMDTFLCGIPEKTHLLKRMFGGEPKILHSLGAEINSILQRLEEINDMRARYGIKSLGESSGSGVGRKLAVRPPVLPDIDDADVVGFDADRDNIVSQLLDESTPRLCVVSIVGPGGLGKTTLAKKVYNRYLSNNTWSDFMFTIYLFIYLFIYKCHACSIFAYGSYTCMHHSLIMLSFLCPC
jgi:Rx N-terminal domain/NB-ARC domain